ncbi:hypothetical protein PVK06_032801 [Gossypium arboreum]|uniref:Uncharacterized protein n=1 Tax=Gossypium arboreum TaxID=29729 RepID=A0ABR0NX98_GOSAR|nr:hypothetical protein PVK06_032801 [Gossypium arboreum]
MDDLNSKATDDQQNTTKTKITNKDTEWLQSTIHLSQMNKEKSITHLRAVDKGDNRRRLTTKLFTRCHTDGLEMLHKLEVLGAAKENLTRGQMAKAERGYLIQGCELTPGVNDKVK